MRITPAGGTRVFEPHHATGRVTCHGGIEVVITVQVSQGHIVDAVHEEWIGVVVPLINRMFRPWPGGRGGIVFKPEDMPVAVFDDRQIRPAIARDVAQRVTFEKSGFVVEDFVLGEVSVTVVLKPATRAHRGIAADVLPAEVQIAVEIDVGAGDSVGIAIVALDQAFGETHLCRRRGGE